MRDWLIVFELHKTRKGEQKKSQKCFEKCVFIDFIKNYKIKERKKQRLIRKTSFFLDEYEKNRGILVR